MPASLFAVSAAATLRVASLDLCADEYALALAAPGQVVSVSHLGKNRQENVYASRAEAIPANDGTVAGVIRQRPDVILTTRTLPSGGRRIAERLGMRIVTLPYADSPTGVSEQVNVVGRLLGRRAAAERWQRDYRRMRAAAPARSIRTLWLSPGGPNVGDVGKSWLAFAGVAPIQFGAARSRVEQVALSRPALVLQSRYRAGQWHRGGDWRAHHLVRRLDAPRVAVDGRPFTCAGPAMPKAIMALQAKLK